MKKLLSKPLSILALHCWFFVGFAISPAILGLVSVTAGCKTSQVAHIQSAEAVHDAVAASLNSWQDYVNREKNRLATLPEGSELNAATLSLGAKEKQVKAALENFKAASALARASTNSVPDTGPRAAAGNAFVVTVKTLIN